MYNLNYAPTILGVQIWREIICGGTRYKKRLNTTELEYWHPDCHLATVAFFCSCYELGECKLLYTWYAGKTYRWWDTAVLIFNLHIVVWPTLILELNTGFSIVLKMPWDNLHQELANHETFLYILWDIFTQSQKWNLFIFHDICMMQSVGKCFGTCSYCLHWSPVWEYEQLALECSIQWPKFV
jgi:hypothetical protein